MIDCKYGIGIEIGMATAYIYGYSNVLLAEIRTQFSPFEF